MNYLITNKTYPIQLPVSTHLSFFNDLFFKDFFSDEVFSSLSSVKKIEYPVDIYENNQGLVIDISVVGLNREDIDIDLKGDVLSVAHNKKSTEVKKNYAYHGITNKSFNLAWRINDKFDLSKTNASLDKGLLKINIPVAPEKQPKETKVTIN